VIEARVWIFPFPWNGDPVLQRNALKGPEETGFLNLRERGVGGSVYLLLRGVKVAHNNDSLFCPGLRDHVLNELLHCILSLRGILHWITQIAFQMQSINVQKLCPDHELCNAPLKVRQEPVLIRRLADGVGCIG